MQLRGTDDRPDNSFDLVDSAGHGTPGAVERRAPSGRSGQPMIVLGFLKKNAVTAASELVAAQLVTPTEASAPASSDSIVRGRPTAQSRRRTSTAAPYVIEVGRC
jgi:hypothetical protein